MWWQKYLKETACYVDELNIFLKYNIFSAMFDLQDLQLLTFLQFLKQHTFYVFFYILSIEQFYTYFWVLHNWNFH